MRVLLVNMPFADLERPALGISLLKSELAERGIECDCYYANIKFSEWIGVPGYRRLLGSDNLYSYSPEWLFAEAAFPEGLPPEEDFLAFLRNFELQSGGDPLSPVVSGLRRVAVAFLDQLMAEAPFGDYDVVGFTSTFQQHLASLALARRVKEAYPHVHTMIGGANCEGEMGVEIHRCCPWIDAVCSGEGDIAVPEYLQRLALGQSTDDLPAIIQRHGGQTVIPDPIVEPVNDINKLPYPDFDDYFAALRGSSVAAALSADQVPLETSRGCWWGVVSHCTFCGLNGSTMTYRSKDADRALDEILALTERYGVKSVFPVDNILDMRYFNTLLPALKERDLKLNMFFEVKANLTKDRIRLMRESGISVAQPGIESLSTAILHLMRKGTTALQNVQTIKWCIEYGINPIYNIITGFPGEDPAEYPPMATLIDSLTHLYAPASCCRVRLDRFSPYFEDPGSFGIRRLDPWPAYRYIYPFDDETLKRIGYYFCYDGIDPVTPPSYAAPVIEAIDRWNRARPQARLTAIDDGEALHLDDTRPIAQQERYTLRDLDRLVYLFCDKAQSERAIFDHMRQQRPDASGKQVLGVLSQLVELRLMARDGDRYLSLAVSLGGWLEKMRGAFAGASQVLAADRRVAEPLLELQPGR